MDKEERMELAKKFTELTLRKYGHIIKSVVVFGSTARGDFKDDSDIDIFVIYDDIYLKKSNIPLETFDSDLKSIGKSVSELIMVSSPWSIIEFIRAVQNGSPMAINIMRDGWALYDSSIFINMKNQLQLGNIYWTFELIKSMVSVSDNNFKSVEERKIKIVAEDLYYGLVNLAFAILVLSGTNISERSEVSGHIEEIVKIADLNNEEANTLREIVKFRDDFEHGRTENVSNEKLAELIELSKKIREKLLDCERALYEKQISIRRERLKSRLEQFKEDLKAKEFLERISNADWAELDRIEAYLEFLRLRK